MSQMILLSIALSWDSFSVGLFFGSLGTSEHRGLRIAMLFAFCDGAAVVGGLVSGGSLGSQLIHSSEVLTVSWLSLILIPAMRFASGRPSWAEWPTYLLPVLFCLDNLVAGPAYARTGVEPILCGSFAGAISGLLFFVGVICGHRTAVRLCATASIRRSCSIKIEADSAAHLERAPI